MARDMKKTVGIRVAWSRLFVAEVGPTSAPNGLHTRRRTSGRHAPHGGLSSTIFQWFTNVLSDKFGLRSCARSDFSGM